MAERSVAWACPSCRERLTIRATGYACTSCAVTIEREDGVLRFAPDFRPTGFSADRRSHLAELTRDHFWFAPRRRLLSGLIDRRVPRGARRAAVELGCGTGGFLDALCRRFDRVVAVDAYEESLAAVPRRPKLDLAQANVLHTPLPAAGFDLVAALDVLEHVEPDAFLREAARLAGPGGWLLLTVPAGPSLWSTLDVAAGHRCRYTLGRLRSELGTAGWRLDHWTHYQLFLWPLVWVSRRVFSAHGGPEGPIERRPPRMVGRLLGAINNAEVRALGRLRLPAGSSLVALARRPS